MADTALAPRPAPALDETMLAMDVVDTLRHADRLVQRELEGDARRAALKQRLREIYAGQGIAVPDRILDQGVAALEEHRFAYTPTPPSLQRSLATLWVTRGRWGRMAGIALAALLLAGGGWWLGVHVPAERARIAQQQELQGLPRALQAEHDRVLAATALPGPRDRAARLLAEGRAAASAGALSDARARLASLQELERDLVREYQVRIVSRPGEQSGVWRVPKANPRARNFYLIVEAVGPDGRPLEVPVTSEEDGTTARVAKWGLHVPEAEFERVRQEKMRTGLIGDPVVGQKRAGELETRWSIPVTGGAILTW
ncbi:DUF6384 family protein [Paracraurococcus lichenis]|uniref:DUF6384 family protein n=1 Tax=Paracraurococcus lichenis TaxID=3064888 RepID=A0ABT9E0G6_9PROT|nr:DUF6384 family protein [Paracraurococcus sp. LOR1-02]MDO9709500.1 DUF6384 family protein [Paracraurococcus sp. LOR1-02]